MADCRSVLGLWRFSCMHFLEIIQDLTNPSLSMVAEGGAEAELSGPAGAAACKFRLGRPCQLGHPQKSAAAPRDRCRRTAIWHSQWHSLRLVAYAGLSGQETGMNVCDDRHSAAAACISRESLLQMRPRPAVSERLGTQPPEVFAAVRQTDSKEMNDDATGSVGGHSADSSHGEACEEAAVSEDLFGGGDAWLSRKDLAAAAAASRQTRRAAADLMRQCTDRMLSRVGQTPRRSVIACGRWI